MPRKWTTFHLEFTSVSIYIFKQINNLSSFYFIFIRKRLFTINESVKMKSDKINNKLEKNLASYDKHNDIQHSIRQHATWIEECWSSLHCMYPFFIYNNNYTLRYLIVISPPLCHKITSQIYQFKLKD